MKLLMIDYEFPPIGGGAARAHFHLLQELATWDDLHIDVITSGLDKGLHTEDFSETIRIHRVGIRKKNLHYWRKLEVVEWLYKAQRHYRQLISENSYDLIHFFFGFPTWWRSSKEIRRIPHVITLWGSDVPGFNVRLRLDYLLLAPFFRKRWRGAAGVVANSEGLRRLALKFMPDIHIDVIPNGIDTVMFSPPRRRDYAAPLKLLSASRLISRKRLDILIRAVAQGLESGLDVQLTLAGEGDLLAELRQLADDLQVSERVQFLGRIPLEDMPEIYRGHDIFLMSSAHEGMSCAMLESMAAGLPLVTSSCEGVDELINDNGIIVSDPTPEAFLKALKDLAGNPERCRQMAQAARRQAEKFSWHNAARQYFEYYQKVIDHSD
ncbi:MAG: glycosyltransferase family 4 protein [Sedimentisphaerales bacterium]|nr:glycosyltransferase family 4 protein [Sedimentisphaerales bacterium]